MKRCLVLSLIAGAAGCSGAGSSGGWFEPRGEPWTILCLEVHGLGCQETADQVAAVLRRTKGIKANRVLVQADGEYARIYYNTYYRRINPATQERSVPQRMEEDLVLLKELADDRGTHYFLHARKVPAPNADVGRAEWDLRRADGVYTLQVAVYFNDERLHDRKLAAVEKVRQLRAKGLEAYYCHGKVQSMVTVGIFGEDAVVDRRGQVRHVEIGGERQQVVHRYSDEVAAIQRRPECKYNLTNDDTWYNLDERGRRLPVRSMLVRIPRGGSDW